MGTGAGPGWAGLGGVPVKTWPLCFIGLCSADWWCYFPRYFLVIKLDQAEQTNKVQTHITTSQ